MYAQSILTAYAVSHRVLRTAVQYSTSVLRKILVCEAYWVRVAQSGLTDQHGSFYSTNMGGLLRDLVKSSLAHLTLSMNVSPRPSLTLLFQSNTGLQEG